MKLFYILLIVVSCNTVQKEKVEIMVQEEVRTIKKEDNNFQNKKKTLLIKSNELEQYLIDDFSQKMNKLINVNSTDLPFEDDNSFEIVNMKNYEIINNNLSVFHIVGSMLPSKADIHYIGIKDSNKVILSEYYFSEAGLDIELTKYEEIGNEILIYGLFHEYIGTDENRQEELDILLDTRLRD